MQKLFSFVSKFIFLVVFVIGSLIILAVTGELSTSITAIIILGLALWASSLAKKRYGHALGKAQVLVIWAIVFPICLISSIAVIVLIVAYINKWHNFKVEDAGDAQFSEETKVK